MTAMTQTRIRPQCTRHEGPPASDHSTLPAQTSDALSDPVSLHLAGVLREAMLAGLPCSWSRRAETLDAARPRPGDFNGRATVEELAERDQRLAEQAEACRSKARFLQEYPDVMAEIIAADVETLMGVSPDGYLT